MSSGLTQGRQMAKLNQDSGSIERDDCLALDAKDPLGHFREYFDLPAGLIYCNGNSLGPLPRKAARIAQRVVSQEWKAGLTQSWNQAGWFHLPQTLGAKLAQLLGARKDEVVMTDGVSVNLFKLLHLALSLNPGRHVILMDGTAFPTDSYTAQGVVAALGLPYRVDFRTTEDLLDGLTDQVAVVCLSDIHYKTGRVSDMAAMTEAAHSVGALTLWDLCHSAGVFPLALNACGADFATGCTYKYLNGGPGSPGYVFVARRHQNQSAQPLWGWWGHASPFAFDATYTPAPGIQQLLVGTQPILSMAVAEAGIDLALRAEMGLVRQKSCALGNLFIAQVQAQCRDTDFTLACPEEDAQRGSQVAFRHPRGYEIIRALADLGVIGDFRAPDVVRFGLAPLFLRYADVWDAAQQLLHVLDAGLWQKAEYRQRSAVT